MLLVGLDAATKFEKFGFACGYVRNDIVQIDRAGLLKGPECSDALAEIIIPALKTATDALIAIDAPLGWPGGMATALGPHMAGELIRTDPGMLFLRETDRDIKKRVGKTPLEVGADRIARTAHAALCVLHLLRQGVGKPIPLAWSRKFEGVVAVEVYPAATLIGWGCDSTGYKKPTDVAAREGIADKLSGAIAGLSAAVGGPADVFDACLCLVAAKDFLDGRAMRPRDHDLAIKEGWIWARRPQ